MTKEPENDYQEELDNHQTDTEQDYYDQYEDHDQLISSIDDLAEDDDLDLTQFDDATQKAITATRELNQLKARLAELEAEKDYHSVKTNKLKELYKTNTIGLTAEQQEQVSSLYDDLDKIKLYNKFIQENTHKFEEYYNTTLEEEAQTVKSTAISKVRKEQFGQFLKKNNLNLTLEDFQDSIPPKILAEFTKGNIQFATLLKKGLPYVNKQNIKVKQTPKPPIQPSLGKLAGAGRTVKTTSKGSYNDYTDIVW